MDGRSLGETLRAARSAAGLTLRDLSSLVDVTPSYISDIENDRRIPAEGVIRKLSVELQLSFDEIMSRAGRVGDEAERYMKRNPAAGVLFRRIAKRRLEKEDLERLLAQVEKMGTKG